MSDDDHYDGILRKALAVNDLPDNFDPNKIPQTGEEYIHYVMYEASQCDEWITANIDKEKFKIKQTSVVYEPKGCLSAPIEIIPTEDWQQRQISDFSAFRLHVEKLKNLNEVTQIFNGDSEQWLKKCSKTPKLNDLLVLNQRALYRVLEFFLEWIEDIANGETIPYSQCVWLYAVLSCLDTPLMPETCSMLREIARKCSEIRSSLPTNVSEELYKPLNLFICIIARYFRNFDLIDNKNEL